MTISEGTVIKVRNAGESTGERTIGLSSLKYKKFRSEFDLEGLDKDKQNAEVQQSIEDMIIKSDGDTYKKEEAGDILHDIFNIAPILNDAAAAIVDDSFLRCFKSAPAEPWNWNFYLFPLWCAGFVVRTFILLPLRFLILMIGFLFFLIGFSIVGLVLRGHARKAAERSLVQFMCQMFVVSWTGVIRYHGARPVAQPGRVWVANHTSMIDYIVLGSCSPFAAIMQLHPGWVGHLQKRYLSALGCLWFNRTQSKDRALVSQRMKEHVWKPDATPLLIFPEGTCVNNEYCVMFKRGAFDLGCQVCPVAIKYNKIFVDAFWNSKRQSFTAHLIQIMRSWALVCDVYFLEPQNKQPGETAQEFAERVQRLIAEKARLRIAPWDGYLKYYNLAEKHPDLTERQRQIYANIVRKHVDRKTIQQLK